MYFTIDHIEARRLRLSTLWDTILRTDEAVLIHSGEPIQKPGGLDQTYRFIPHPAYYWISGRRRENEVVFYSKEIGWIEFQKDVPAAEAIWERERTDLLVQQEGASISDLEEFLIKNKFATLHNLGQVSAVEGKTFELRTMLDQTRRVKDEAEVKLVRQIADIANHGYQEVRKMIRAGISEKEVQICYESEVSRKGSQHMPYDSIVGSGVNSAILHALPSEKIIEENEFVLIDAGADIYDYCVDITRMFYSSDNLTSQHKSLYDLVLKANQACASMATEGVLWRDVHIYAAKIITEGLLDLGVLKGDLNTLYEREVASVFFPHGLGHLVGLRVRDAGHEDNLNPKNYFGARLRVDITLAENHLVTVEPGCYFIKSLLESQDIQKKFADEINWTEVNKWKHIGGVRIEDNILIGKSGNENLTADVEKLGS